MSHLDWMPTLLAAAGEPGIREKLLQGHSASGRRFRVHLDGHNQLPLLTGSGDSKREEIFYFTDDGILAALRFNDWKVVFSEQRAKGWDVWRDPFVVLRMPKVFNLRSDPFERADQEASDYDHWSIDRLFFNYEAQYRVKRFLDTFDEYPQRQTPASFTIDQLVSKKLAK